MTSYVGLLQQGLFYGFLTVLLVSTAIAVLYTYCRSHFESLSAEARATLLFNLCVLPVVVMALLLLSALLPSLLQILGMGSDHCEGHTEGHIHFCLIHRPALLDSWLLSGSAFVFLGMLTAIVGNILVDVSRSWRFRKVLANYQTVSVRDSVHVLASDLPIAFSWGIWSPRIIVSTGLLKVLSPEERAIVIAHEKTHMSRRDGLFGLMARAFSIVHIPQIRKHLLTDWHLANEQLCDKTAAKLTQDPGAVAELLLKMERLYQAHFPFRGAPVLGVMGNDSSKLPARIEELLKPVASESCVSWLLPCAVLVTLMLFGVHDQIHEAFEHALGLLID